MIIRIIYTIFFSLALPFIILNLKFKKVKKNKGYGKRILERLGFTPFTLKNSIWVHSVSMGESIAIAPLVKNLIKKYPNKNFVITTMTPTGSEQVLKIYKKYKNVYHCYLPYDIPILLNRFLKRINPTNCIIMETELWPNLLYCNHKKGIKTVLTNARLSQKSAKGYKKIKFLMTYLFKKITYIIAQEKNDYERFLSIGVNENKISYTGNIKYDISITDEQLKKGIEIKNAISNKKVFIAGSTHQGEDEIILESFSKLNKDFKDLLLILVPRHPERFNNVLKLCENNGFITERRSKVLNKINEKTQIYLADTMGEMMSLLYASDIAFIGGSLIKRGGHNTLEPASLKKCVLSGEYNFNFAKTTELLLNKDALIIVKNANEIYENVSKLFNDKNLYDTISKNAFEVVEANKGALKKQTEIITKFL